jgi:hypothetical protein
VDPQRGLALRHKKVRHKGMTAAGLGHLVIRVHLRCLFLQTSRAMTLLTRGMLPGLGLALISAAFTWYSEAQYKKEHGDSHH